MFTNFVFRRVVAVVVVAATAALVVVGVFLVRQQLASLFVDLEARQPFNKTPSEDRDNFKVKKKKKKKKHKNKTKKIDHLKPVNRAFSRQMVNVYVIRRLKIHIVV